VSEPVDLGRRIAARLGAATLERVGQVGLANAELNAPRIRRSILELAETPLGAGEAAVVIGAGPSLRRRRSLERLAVAGFAGSVVAVDSALGACLRHGIVPHLVVTVDPHSERIVRWFGDPALTAPSADDYFRRQEMDPVHAEDELAANRALLELVDRHGPGMRVAIATSAAPAVADRCEKAGMRLYWWNPMYDDYDQPGSLSRRLHAMNRLPCLNGGGNVGTAAWVVSHAVLGKRQVGLLGLDFGYLPSTPYSKTQYYPELVELFGDRFTDAFIHLPNPDTGETWFTDPAYYWFREVFLEMAKEAACETFNCTEGGVLFGPGVTSVGVEEFVAIVQDGRALPSAGHQKDHQHG
jgi:6-hydroxymethylpterin diphosphokinase MptE-like protein